MQDYNNAAEVEEEDGPISVTLTWEEMKEAATVGICRNVESLRQGDKNAHGYDGSDTWTVNIEGACAELAFAKAMGIKGDGGINTYKAADVGNDWQVRWSPEHGNRLIVRSNDSDDHRFVLVSGQSPSFRIQGWRRGRDAKRPYWREAPCGRPAAYFVPKNCLRPIDPILAA